ncbi:MAG TPA: hypothetical protein VF181_12745 [Balneolaceae bacterium]
MKSTLLILSVMFFVSCGTGPQGPAGPPGPPGPPGLIGQAFEAQVNFDASNNYSQIVAFPSSIEVFTSDIVLAYLLWEVDESTGQDVWQPLPVSVFFNDGELQYAFDHTATDVRLFLTGDKDLNTVGPAFTQDQIFRIVILPVEYVQSSKINLNDVNEVMNIVNTNKIKRLHFGEN